MNRAWWWLIIAILVIGVVAIFYIRWTPEAPAPQEAAEPAAEPEATSPLPPEEPEDPPAFVTEPPAEPPEPLPELEESDEEAKEALSESAGDPKSNCTARTGSSSTAGSSFSFRRMNGSMDPASVPKRTTPSRLAAPSTRRAAARLSDGSHRSAGNVPVAPDPQ